MTADSSFTTASKVALGMPQLRTNLRHATSTIRDKRLSVTAELSDWEQLRDSAAAIKADTRQRLPELLEEFESKASAAGATVHWARDAAEAASIVADITKRREADKIVKVKSMATQEIELNERLAAEGIRAHETDLAELIVQLADDKPSHILVPAIHYNRRQIRDIFASHKVGSEGLSDDPAALAEASRAYLRRRFLSASVAVSGANFAIAQTGSLVVVESEGNGRMCLTLPQTLISVVGVEKLLPRFEDLEVFMPLLPRSSTGERMNPYTSIWTGNTDGDGPEDVHIVLLDNGRANVLSDPVGREALACIRCSACLNVCPVYEHTGGHAYASVYPGPIGAILAPQLSPGQYESLPYASSLCGACYDACPVKIDIPRILVHLRQRVTHPPAERAAMGEATRLMTRPRRWKGVVAAARLGAKLLRPLTAKGRLTCLPGPAAQWTRDRDLPLPPSESFRQWWRREEESQ